MLPRFQFALCEQEGWLWCRFAPTLRPADTGSGKAKASGQRLPFICPLFNPLVCSLQARLRTFAVNGLLGTCGNEMVC